MSAEGFYLLTSIGCLDAAVTLTVCYFFVFLSRVLPIIFHSHLLDLSIHSSWTVSNLSGNEQLDEEMKKRAGYGDCCKDLQMDHPELLLAENLNAMLLLHDPHTQFLFWWQTSLPHKLSYPTASLSFCLTEDILQFADWCSHRHITIHTDWVLLKLFPASSPFPKKKNSQFFSVCNRNCSR